MDGLRRIAKEQQNRQDAASEVLQNQVRELRDLKAYFASGAGATSNDPLAYKLK
jgi:hypothetical protein